MDWVGGGDGGAGAVIIKMVFVVVMVRMTLRSIDGWTGIYTAEQVIHDRDVRVIFLQAK